MARLDLDVDNGHDHQRNAPVDMEQTIRKYENESMPSEGKEPAFSDMLEVAESFIRNSNEEFSVFSNRVEANQNAIDRMIGSVDEELNTLSIRVHDLHARRDVLSQRLQELQRVRESGQKVRETFNAALATEKNPNEVAVIRNSLLNPSNGRRLSDNPQA